MKVYTENVVKCHSCKETMDLRDPNRWLLYAGLVFHDTGSCRDLYEKLRHKEAKDA